jgi:hypothetical protein
VKDAISTSPPELSGSPPYDSQEGLKKKRFTLKGLFSRSTGEGESYFFFARAPLTVGSVEEAEPKKDKLEKEKEKEKERDRDKEKEKERLVEEKVSPALSPKEDRLAPVRSPSPVPQHTITPASSLAASDPTKGPSRALSPPREKDPKDPSRALSPERPRDGSAVGSKESPSSLKSLWDRIRRRGSQTLEPRPYTLVSLPGEVEEPQPGEYEPLATLLLHSPNFFIAYAIGISVPVTEVDVRLYDGPLLSRLY